MDRVEPHTRHGACSRRPLQSPLLYATLHLGDTVFAMDPSTGAVLWRRSGLGTVSAPVVLPGTETLVFLASHNSGNNATLVTMAGATGTLLSNVSVPGVSGTSPSECPCAHLETRQPGMWRGACWRAGFPFCLQP